MLNCNEQVQVQKYKTLAKKTPKTAGVQTITLKYPTKQTKKTQLSQQTHIQQFLQTQLCYGGSVSGCTTFRIAKCTVPMRCTVIRPLLALPLALIQDRGVEIYFTGVGRYVSDLTWLVCPA